VLLNVFTQFPVFFYYTEKVGSSTTMSQQRMVWSSETETMELEEGSSFCCLLERKESQETEEL
jgi:hypothetical protein